MTTSAVTKNYTIPDGWHCVRCLGLHYYCVDCGDVLCVCPEDMKGHRVVCEHDRHALKKIDNGGSTMTRVRDLISRALERVEYLPITDDEGDEFGGMYMMHANEIAERLVNCGWRWTPESERREDTFELERRVGERHAQIRLVFGSERDVPHGFTAIEAVR